MYAAQPRVFCALGCWHGGWRLASLESCGLSESQFGVEHALWAMQMVGEGRGFWAQTDAGVAGQPAAGAGEQRRGIPPLTIFIVESITSCVPSPPGPRPLLETIYTDGKLEVGEGWWGSSEAPS